MPEHRNDKEKRIQNPPRSGGPGKKTKAHNRGRLIIYGIVLLGVIAGAVLLCIFAFFRINNIEINGTAIYSAEDIAAELGLSEGDNLVFADTSSYAEKLQSKFPYIEKAEIVKKIPSTIEVDITEAQVYYSFVYGDKYIYVSRSGKMLETQDEPMTGSMVVKGVDIKANGNKIEFSDISKASIFQDISVVFTEKENIGITELNLENVHAIYIVYDGRVKMILGSAADLSYKLTFGLQIAGSIGAEEKGILDLTHAKDINTGYFMPDISSSSPPDKPKDESGSEPEGTESTESTQEESSTEESGTESGNDESSEDNSSTESGNGESSEEGGESSEEVSVAPSRGDDIPDA